jgi:hypothetical protein
MYSKMVILQITKATVSFLGYYHLCVVPYNCDQAIITTEKAFRCIQCHPGFYQLNYTCTNLTCQDLVSQINVAAIPKLAVCPNCIEKSLFQVRNHAILLILRLRKDVDFNLLSM